ncbi:MAG TPA: hypothetical protein VKZ85_13335 [Woeseiaceae bacterium]|nr:hypothetical protein [Woeseiaceae bacterium]
MRPDRFFAELYRRNPLLALIGWLHVIALLACAGAWLADDRLVLGSNAWVKPVKFMASTAVYLWTVAWLTRYVRRPRRAMKSVSVVIAAATVIHNTCIVLQAARGTPSHFNVATDFDAAVFHTMSAMALVNLLAVVAILFRFARPSTRLPAAYLWGIRAGIVLFLAGGAIGILMLALDTHSVGAGDLRIPHGMALHALQVLPLAGWGLSRWGRLGGPGARLTLLAAAASGYAALVYALVSRALVGGPLP